MGEPLYFSFLDLSKAYDRVNREVLYDKLVEHGFGGRTVQLIKAMYNNDCLQFLVNGELTKLLYLTGGLKQGCNLSPTLFNIMMYDMARELQMSGGGVEINGRKLCSAIFVDDIAVGAVSREGLERLVKIVYDEGLKFNMVINEKSMFQRWIVL